MNGVGDQGSVSGARGNAPVSQPRPARLSGETMSSRQRVLVTLNHEEPDRVRIFGPGGGFVFNTIHNIQQATPPENIVAAYETARTVGRYPVR